MAPNARSRLGRWLRRGPALVMDWRHVLFANWPVDPAVVAPHVPDALTLDTHEGRAWLSVVPFTNASVRPAGLPAAASFALPELNLRTYVEGPAGPGVYFHSLDADGLLGVVGARLLHHLPYYRADIDLAVEDGRVSFTCRRRHPGARPVAFAATYGPTATRVRSEPGSLAAFLAERYRYYTEAPDGSLRAARIDHDTWPLWEATVAIEANTLFAANDFAYPESDPVHLYSPGVLTRATPGQRVDTARGR